MKKTNKKTFVWKTAAVSAKPWLQLQAYYSYCGNFCSAQMALCPSLSGQESAARPKPPQSVWCTPSWSIKNKEQQTSVSICAKKKSTSNNKPMSEGLGKTLFEKRPNKLEALNSYLATRYHNSTEVTAGSQAPPAALQGLEGAKNFPISPLNLWPFELFLLLNDETAKPARLPPKNPLSNIKQHVIKKYQEISRMIHKIFHFHPTLASFCLNSSFSAAASA